MHDLKFPIGVELESIWYLVLPGDRVSAGDKVDSVSWAVQLVFADESELGFHWQLDQGSGCLVATSTLPHHPFEVRQDASGRWPELIGLRLSDAIQVVHETDRGATLWSVRLAFDQDRSLVVALGEKDESGSPTYLPDGLIVTDSEVVASSYVVPGAPQGAWG